MRAADWDRDHHSLRVAFPRERGELVLDYDGPPDPAAWRLWLTERDDEGSRSVSLSRDELRFIARMLPTLAALEVPALDLAAVASMGLVNVIEECFEEERARRAATDLVDSWSVDRAIAEHRAEMEAERARMKRDEAGGSDAS